MTYSQPGIFNALDDWGAGFGMSPTNSGPDNAAALQATINAAQASSNSNGAIVLIPSFAVDSEGANVYGSYPIAAASIPAITIPDTGYNANPLLIMGTGPGTTLVMQTPGSILFSVNSPFTEFQDLTIVDGSEDETSAGTAFDFLNGSGSKGYKLFRVSIVDFPNAIVFGNEVLAANVLACTISYDTSYSGVNCTAIQTSGAETNIEQCSLTFGASGSGTYIGIDIIGSSDARVTDTQVSGFGTGIVLGAEGEGNATGANFTGLDIDAVIQCVHINGTSPEMVETLQPEGPRESFSTSASTNLSHRQPLALYGCSTQSLVRNSQKASPAYSPYRAKARRMVESAPRFFPVRRR